MIGKQSGIQKFGKVCCTAALLLLVLDSVRAEPRANVRDFGAKGDAVTDDTAAIRAAFKASRNVYFPAGVYVLTDGLVLPESASLAGDGAPMLGAFPMLEDDKRFLSPGKVAQMPGTTLLFKGRGQQVQQTPRRDAFRELRFALKTTGKPAISVQRLGIVLDETVLDERGEMTTPQTDRRADYDVGLLIDDTAASCVREVTVFGFWKKAGLCLISRGQGDNPDYNTFWNCSFMGEYGVAILGMDEAEGPGLSGTQFYGCRIFANDHHHRPAHQWGSAAVLIDGNTRAKRADINGHYFFGGCVRTYSPVGVKLDHASNVSFYGMVFELPPPAGTDRKGAGKIVGTANTRDVYLFGCRMQEIGLNELGRTMADGSLVVFPDSLHGVSVHQAGRVARLSAALNSGPELQLTDDASSAVSGWTMRLDADKQLSLNYAGNSKAKLSAEGELRTARVQSGEVTAAELKLGAPKTALVTEHRVKAAGSRLEIAASVATTLETIEGGSEGQFLVLEVGQHKSARIEIPVKPSGNIRLGRPMVFGSSTARLVLLHSGGEWVELSRAD